MSSIFNLPALPPSAFATAIIPAVVPGNPPAGIFDRTYGVSPLALSGPAVRATAMVLSPTQVALEGLPVLPPGATAMRLNGFVTLTDTATGDAASWDIAVLVGRNPQTGVPAIIGNSTVALWQAGPTMGAVPTPIVMAAINGVGIYVAGITGRTFAATGAFTYA